MLKKILVVLAAALVLLLGVVASRPSAYRIERSTTAAAPPAAAFALVADFHRWEGWSPWARLDPAMKTEFGGPAQGTGATYHWKGNQKVGEGRMTITSATPASELVIRLEFLAPWAQVSTTTFTFAPEGAGTRVTWAMTGTHDFVGKAFTLFMDMDKAVGPDFEKGLAALRGLAEAEARKAAAPPPAGPAALPPPGAPPTADR